MTTDTPKTGAVLVSHGSPREQANQQFVDKMDHVARRLGDMPVQAGFFSMAEPTISDCIGELVERDMERILILPYFLHNGQHVTVDIPEQIEACRQEYPSVKIDVMPTLQDETALEDILVQRLAEYMPVPEEEPQTGQAIQNTSFDIIDARLSRRDLDPHKQPIIRRVIHATADFSFADTMRIHPDAIERGKDALVSDGPVICDVTMLRQGVTHVGCDVLCAIGEADVAEQAERDGTTRSAMAMEKLSEHFPGAIVAIGNAPTALWRVMEIAKRGGPEPALVVGVPVGFVGALESKLALLDSDLCYITNAGNRGGTPVAASVVNALANL